MMMTDTVSAEIPQQSLLLQQQQPPTQPQATQQVPATSGYVSPDVVWSVEMTPEWQTLSDFKSQASSILHVILHAPIGSSSSSTSSSSSLNSSSSGGGGGGNSGSSGSSGTAAATAPPQGYAKVLELKLRIFCNTNDVSKRNEKGHQAFNFDASVLLVEQSKNGYTVAPCVENFSWSSGLIVRRVSVRTCGWVSSLPYSRPLNFVPTSYQKRTTKPAYLTFRKNLTYRFDIEMHPQALVNGLPLSHYPYQRPNTNATTTSTTTTGTSTATTAAAADPANTVASANGSSMAWQLVLNHSSTYTTATMPITPRRAYIHYPFTVTDFWRMTDSSPQKDGPPASITLTTILPQRSTDAAVAALMGTSTSGDIPMATAANTTMAAFTPGSTPVSTAATTTTSTGNPSLDSAIIAAQAMEVATLQQQLQQYAYALYQQQQQLQASSSSSASAATTGTTGSMMINPNFMMPPNTALTALPYAQQAYTSSTPMPMNMSLSSPLSTASHMSSTPSLSPMPMLVPPMTHAMSTVSTATAGTTGTTTGTTSMPISPNSLASSIASPRSPLSPASAQQSQQPLQYTSYQQPQSQSIKQETGHDRISGMKSKSFHGDDESMDESMPSKRSKFQHVLCNLRVATMARPTLLSTGKPTPQQPLQPLHPLPPLGPNSGQSSFVKQERGNTWSDFPSLEQLLQPMPLPPSASAPSSSVAANNHNILNTPTSTSTTPSTHSSATPSPSLSPLSLLSSDPYEGDNDFDLYSLSAPDLDSFPPLPQQQQQQQQQLQQQQDHIKPPLSMLDYALETTQLIFTAEPEEDIFDVLETASSLDALGSEAQLQLFASQTRGGARKTNTTTATATVSPASSTSSSSSSSSSSSLRPVEALRVELLRLLSSTCEDPRVSKLNDRQLTAVCLARLHASGWVTRARASHAQHKAKLSALGKTKQKELHAYKAWAAKGGIRWPHHLELLAALRKDGFEHRPTPLQRDRCVCKVCGFVYFGWQPNDDVSKFHFHAKHR